MENTGRLVASDTSFYLLIILFSSNLATLTLLIQNLAHQNTTMADESSLNEKTLVEQRFVDIDNDPQDTHRCFLRANVNAATETTFLIENCRPYYLGKIVFGSKINYTLVLNESSHPGLNTRK